MIVLSRLAFFMEHDKILGSVRAFLSRAFEGRDLSDDDDIFALGFGNSLFAIQMVTFVEGEFSIEIDSEDLEMSNFRSINAVSALVERKLASRNN